MFEQEIVHPLNLVFKVDIIILLIMIDGDRYLSRISRVWPLLLLKTK